MAPSADQSQSNSSSDTGQDEREATELHAINSIDSSSELNGFATPSAQTGSSRTTSIVKTFWKRHVVATVPHEACRDHFGM